MNSTREMSSKGPRPFSDIGRKARDLLISDYSSDQKFSVTTFSDTGLALSSTVLKKGGLYSGDVVTQYNYKNAAVKVKIDTGSNVASGALTADILPSTKAIVSFTLPHYNSGRLEVQYFHEHAAFTTAIGLNKSPAVEFSATIGTPSIAFGAETSFLPDSGRFAKYNAGVSLTKPDSTASVVLADKGDLLRFSYLHHLNGLNGGAAIGEVTRKFSTNENTLTVGCSYVLENHTVVKAKLNNHGNLGALLRHEITPKSFLTVSGAFETKALEKKPKFGLALSLKP